MMPVGSCGINPSIRMMNQMKTPQDFGFMLD
jgi:hypothetical protein